MSGPVSFHEAPIRNLLCRLRFTSAGSALWPLVASYILVGCVLLWQGFASLFDAIPRVLGLTSNALADLLISVLLLSLVAGLLSLASHVAWSRFHSGRLRECLLAGGIVRKACYGRAVLHLKGIVPHAAEARARTAITRWSLDSESVTLCPLPDLNLAWSVLAGAIILGFLALVACYLSIDMLSALSMPHRPRLNPIAFFVVLAGLICAYAIRWSVGSPVVWGGVALTPGRIIRHGIFRSRQADSATDELFVNFATPSHGVHTLVVFPKVGPAWWLHVPGQAVDLVLGAWIARDIGSPSPDPNPLTPSTAPSASQATPPALPATTSSGPS